ncbi:hypothetical protein IWW38_002059 [Coemansia aciculifera]|uniref:Uncharacterized protein n=1 Tax=Coemansia aciculifera TaxID=417176 RepID=A0ACC1M693_9FUNG|nr:hypothetical protein IWW38_002059 [Coemansia aciculifera]
MWLMQMTMYVSLLQPHATTVDLACMMIMNLQEMALEWYMSIQVDGIYPDLPKTFFKIFKDVFTPIDDDLHVELQLHSLTQTGMVQQYVNAFQALIMHIKNMDEPKQHCRFTDGLKKPLHDLIDKSEHKSFLAVCKFALLQDVAAGARVIVPPACNTSVHSMSDTVADSMAMDVDSLQQGHQHSYGPHICYMCGHQGHMACDCSQCAQPQQHRLQQQGCSNMHRQQQHGYCLQQQQVNSLEAPAMHAYVPPPGYALVPMNQFQQQVVQQPSVFLDSQ